MEPMSNTSTVVWLLVGLALWLAATAINLSYAGA
jgi:hypothetical protein